MTVVFVNVNDIKIFVAIIAVLSSDENIRLVAESIYKIHEKETKDRRALKLLLKQHQEVQKKTDNIIKAIEMEIITEQTKTRLKELEEELLQIDFDMDREKTTHSYVPYN